MDRVRLVLGSHRWLLLAALSLLALALSTAMFSGASFSSRSANSAALATGSIQLSTSAPNQAIVTETSGVKPGWSKEGTIKVSNEVDSAGTVTLKGTGLTGTTLAGVLDLEVKEGSTLKWSGKLSALSSVSLGSIGASASRTFRFILSWPKESTSASLQGTSTSLTFQWVGTWSGS